MMPKYCGYCGKPIEGDVKACGNCGASLKNMRSDHLSKRKNKDVISVVVIFVLIAIIAFNVISGFVGAKGAARKVIKAYIDNDVDTLLNIASDYYYIQTDLSGISIGTYFEDQIDTVIGRYEGYLGEDYKMKYKITDSYNLNDHRAKTIYNKMSALDDYDMENVSKIAVVEVDVKVEGESLSFTESWELIIVKESNDWRLFSVGLNNKDISNKP